MIVPCRARGMFFPVKTEKREACKGMEEIARLETCLYSGVVYCTVPQAAAVRWLFGVAPQSRGGAAPWRSWRVRCPVRVANERSLGGFKTTS